MPSSATEFCPRRNLKRIVCSVNTYFDRNVNIAKLAYIVDYSLNCSDLYKPIKTVSLFGVPWILILYRNMKKEQAHFSQKRKSFFLLYYFVFLDNFYLEGTGSNEQKHFCQNFLPKKALFYQSSSQSFLFF